MHENEISRHIVNAALTVHKNLGPGLLESAYLTCLEYELLKTNLSIRKQVPLPLIYKNVELDCGYRIDLWVNSKVIIEIKAVDALNDVHFAQILTYLKLTDNHLGLLINFNVVRIKHGIRRVVNNL